MLPQALADSTHVEIEGTFLLCKQFHRLLSQANPPLIGTSALEKKLSRYLLRMNDIGGCEMWRNKKKSNLFSESSRKKRRFTTRAKRAYLKTCSCVGGSNLLMLLNNLNSDVMKHASSDYVLEMVPGL